MPGLPTTDICVLLNAAGISFTSTSTADAGRTLSVRLADARCLNFCTEDPESGGEVHLLTSNGVCLGSVLLRTGAPTARDLVAAAKILATDGSTDGA